jgi:hypothetical protein
MQKVDGVQTVKVSLKDGLTILDLKPGNSVTLATLRQVIKNNGFVSKEAQVLGGGSPSGSSGDWRFKVSGTNEELSLSSEPKRSGNDWQLAVRAPAKP